MIPFAFLAPVREQTRGETNRAPETFQSGLVLEETSKVTRTALWMFCLDFFFFKVKDCFLIIFFFLIPVFLIKATSTLASFPTEV